MRYKVLKQCGYDDTRFDLEREDGRVFSVDIYTDGGLEMPESIKSDDVDKFNKNFSKWLKSFIGKTIEVPNITPYAYYSTGNIQIIEEDKDIKYDWGV